MIDYASNETARVEALLAFSMGMIQGGNGAELISKYQEAIKHITPYDMLALEDEQLLKQVTVKEIKTSLDKVINVFYQSLASYQWEKPNSGTFLHTLMLENEALDLRLTRIKKILLEDDYPNNRMKLCQAFQELRVFMSHYEKKENILFPYFEKKVERYRALQVMWSLHDEIRTKLKQVIKQLETKKTAYTDVKVTVGKLFFLMYGMIQKENLVLFPVSQEMLTEGDHIAMQRQSYDYAFPFIDPPQMKKEPKQTLATLVANRQDVFFQSETGELSFEQLLMMLNKLPIDITFVDQDDKVRYYSNGPERIFPRSPAIIGRTVQNCHPPESVHVVEKIISGFKKGERDIARFWLELQGKFILIQYYALRDTNDVYCGVLEVSQDVTGIRQIKGQKRLLDWQ